MAAALKKDIRIMRTTEDSSKLSQRVFWNKKIQAMRDRSIIVGPEIFARRKLLCRRTGKK